MHFEALTPGPTVANKEEFHGKGAEELPLLMTDCLKRRLTILQENRVKGKPPVFVRK